MKFSCQTKHLWSFWKSIYEECNWKAHVILLFNLTADNHQSPAALSKENILSMNFKTQSFSLTGIKWHYSEKREGSYVRRKIISEKKPCYECKQCVEMSNITFTVFWKIWAEKYMALLKYSTHVHWFISQGTVIVACLEKVRHQNLEACPGSFKYPRGLAFCDSGWLPGWRVGGQWLREVGKCLFYLLLYSYFYSNKINTSL